MICVEIKDKKRILKIAMDNGDWVDTKINEPSRKEPITETEASHKVTRAWTRNFRNRIRSRKVKCGMDFQEVSK
jgi:hypothetical protein